MDDRSIAQISWDLLERLDRPVQDTVEYAFEDKDPDIIEELLNKDMSPNIETKYGNSLRNISELMTFLIKDCNISEKRVHSAIKKMQYTY